VLDASQFSLADRKRFAVTFGERLWQRKKGEAHPVPLHLVIEESQLIVPQFTGRGGDEGRMVGIYEEIIRLGRNYGIGVSMITQRPQSVNKEVLNQTECLLVGQVNGAQERDALKKWISHQGMDVHLVDELPRLKAGTFYVWSPQWLNLLQRVRIEPKRTYDASATPKVGDRHRNRAGDMAGFVFVRGTRIQNDDVGGPRPLEQFLHRDRLARAVAKVIPHEPIEFGQSALGHRSQRTAEIGDGGIGETVVDELALLAAFHECCLAQGLQMLRGVRDGRADFTGERIDGALTLAEELEQLQAMGAAEGLPDARELRIQAVFEVAVGIGRHRLHIQ
jgi:hypothetical protein